MPTTPADQPLSGLGVLVTRPPDQAETLCRLIETAGGTPWRLAAMEIRPLPMAAPVVLDGYDMAIFISANAVQHGLAQLRGQTRYACVGAATARALANVGIERILVPEAGFDSESLLALEPLREIRGQRVLIVRGRDGRETLAQGLRQRGATVDYLEVYERVAAQTDTKPVLRAWQRGAIDLATITSADLLEHLANLLGDEGMALLRATPTVVFGPRLAEKARAMGIEQVQPAPSNDDTGLLQGLVALSSR
ncbi:MAG: uroporphyrinogen-III synthase [Chromatiales bacterium]|nr:uroporphyrinogen-III synthase [Chromatiales bacterium]